MDCGESVGNSHKMDAVSATSVEAVSGEAGSRPRKCCVQFRRRLFHFDTDLACLKRCV